LGKDILHSLGGENPEIVTSEVDCAFISFATTNLCMWIMFSINTLREQFLTLTTE
jgi:hypothetical protein